MTPSPPSQTTITRERWVMGMPFRVDHYRKFAHALEESGHLRMSFLWKRNGYPEVPAEKTRLKPILGAAVYVSAKYVNTNVAEKFRFRLYQSYDRWMSKQLKQGDFVYSSYGYANQSFKRVKELGGVTFIDGGNSHPENFWNILKEENERWGVKKDPICRYHYERSIAMMEHTDCVVSPSGFVTKSFTDRGFARENIFDSFYPVNLSLFSPSEGERPKDKPFTIINTSGLSLRKGTPYLLETFRRIHKEVPNVRFLVTRSGNPSAEIDKLLKDYTDLPIEWSAYLSHKDMAKRFQEADLLMLPSLEDGFARVVTEAMACGLPAIVSENTGAADFIEAGVSGSTVPIRDVDAMVKASMEWWDKIRDGYKMPVENLQNRLSPEAYEKRVIEIAEQAEAMFA